MFPSNGSNNNGRRKRVLMDQSPTTAGTETAAGKKKGRVEETTSSSRQQRLYVELTRLLQAMEQNDNPDVSWQSLRMRADHAQNLWQTLLKQQQETTPPDAALEARVVRACQRAVEVSEQVRSRDDDPDQQKNTAAYRIFYSQKKKTPVRNGAAVVSNVASPAAPAAAGILQQDKTTTIAKPPPPPSQQQQQQPSVEELQKAQREQIEEAISAMASQMKTETQRIHTTLKGQTDGLLDKMQDVTQDNVEKVTEIAQDVQQHNEKNNWSRTLGTWTMLFLMAGAFVFCIITIQMVPKQQRPGAGACLIWCDDDDAAVRPAAAVDDRYCRILPNGQKECLDLTEGSWIREPEEVAEPAAERELEDKVEEEPEVTTPSSGQQKECVMGMDGECIPTTAEEDNVYDEESLALGKDLDEEEQVAVPQTLEEEEQPVEQQDSANAENTAPPQPKEDEDEAPAVQHDSAADDETAHDEEEEYDEDDGETEFEEHDEDDDFDFTDADIPLPPSASVLAEYMETLAPEDLEEPQQQRQTKPEAAAASDDPYGVFTSDNAAAAAEQQQQQGGPPLYKGRPFSPRDVRSAAAQNDVQALRAYMDIKGVEFADKQDKNGWNALHLAARAGHAEIVRILLAAGANVDLLTNSGMSAMEIAASSKLGNDHEVIRMLLLRGGGGDPEPQAEEAARYEDEESEEADSEEEHLDQDEIEEDEQFAADEDEEDALEVDEGEVVAEEEAEEDEEQSEPVEDDTEAVKEGQTEQQRIQLEQPPPKDNEPLQTDDQKEADAIPFDLNDVHYAASLGNANGAEQLRYFLSVSKEWGERGDGNGWNAMHLAARAGSVENLRILLDAGCDPSLPTRSDQTALDILIMFHGEEHPAIPLLDPTQVDEFKDDEIIEDEQPENEEDYQDEAEEEQRPEEEQLQFGLSEVHAAAAYEDDVDYLRRFLQVGGTEYGEAGDDNGWNAYHIAARTGNTAGLAALLEAGCEKSLRNNQGRTALELLILEHGPDHPAVTLLGEFQLQDVFEAANLPELEQVLRYYVNVEPEMCEQPDEHGWTPMHIAARAGNVAAVKVMVEAGCDPGIPNHSDHTPLDVVVQFHGEDHPAVALLDEYN